MSNIRAIHIIIKKLYQGVSQNMPHGPHPVLEKHKINGKFTLYEICNVIKKFGHFAKCCKMVSFELIH